MMAIILTLFIRIVVVDRKDEIIAIIRKAQRDGVDVESDLRCRLRDIESEIEHIERTMNHE